MAAIPTELEVEPARERSRLNEIIVIALAAAALLLGLCLVSYHPNDPSWNAAGESSAQNWIGAIGANVAAALFQTIGLAAYLVPVLILAAAWRRFRAQRINAPIYQLLGLVIVVFSAAALLSLAHLRPV
ncbi:MAG TPA: DNA translocase FtsK 4TM domain-containing protein, partial [Pyrinomonadaceae bacterium]|nr:DNA translocase FtsK 4TM domain-containing protein [Pyrinomonadaceae bacterium]